METKKISIADEAYKALKKAKFKGESFSGVILRLTSRRGKLIDSFGKWKISKAERKRIYKVLRKEWRAWEND